MTHTLTRTTRLFPSAPPATAWREMLHNAARRVACAWAQVAAPNAAADLLARADAFEAESPSYAADLRQAAALLAARTSGATDVVGAAGRN